MARGASHYKELEDMLKTFRCQDLANLLAYANHPKNGKKTELYERCQKLLEKGSVPVQMKIRDIYNSKNLLQLNGPNNLSSSINTSTATTFQHQTANNHDLFSNNVTSSSLRQASNYYNNNSNSSNSLMGIQSNGFHNNLIQNEIKFKRLAFYENLHEVTKPIILHPVSSSNRPYQFTFQFSLQIQHADEISVSRHVVDGKYEYTTQIQLRFALIENTTEQSDTFPPNTNVNVNGKPAPLPPPKPTSKPNADMIRPGRSVDITNLCRLAPSMANKVDVTWTNTDTSKVYCVAVFIVKKLSTQSLLDRLLKNNKKGIEFSKQLVKEKLEITDNDLEIETSTLKASLLCPLMKCRIRIPGRSKLCKHVQCFDLTSYLSMNEKKPTWNCPVCDRNAPFDDLIIDGYFDEILQKCPDCDEIQFYPNGEWAKIEIKKKVDKSNKVNVVNTSPIKTTDIKPIQKSTTNNTTSLNPPAPKIICVDLTIDSSDDENDTYKKNISNSNSNNNNNEKHLRSTTIDDNPASPTNSVIAVSSSSSSPSQHRKCDFPSDSSRSNSPNNLVINTDEHNTLLDKDQIDSIGKSPISNGCLQLNNPNVLSPASLIPTTPAYSPQSPVTTNQSLPSSPLAVSMSRQQATQNNNYNNQNSPDFTTNLLFSKSPPIIDIKRSNSTTQPQSFNYNNRKNSTSSSGSNTPASALVMGNGIMCQLYEEGRRSPISPMSPSLRDHSIIKNINMKAKNNVIKPSLLNKEKAQKIAEDMKTNLNPNYFLKDPSKLSSPRDSQKHTSNQQQQSFNANNNNFSTFQSLIHNNSNRNNNNSSNTNNSNNINNQYNQQIGFNNNNNNKNYQITSSNNLKIRLTNNNNNNIGTSSSSMIDNINNGNYSSTINEEMLQHYTNTLFASHSIPITNVINKQQHQQQQQQILNNQVFSTNQGRSMFNGNGNSSSNSLTRSNLSSSNYAAKNSNIYQTSSRSNNPYDVNYRFSNQHYPQSQPQAQHHNHLSLSQAYHSSLQHTPQHTTHGNISNSNNNIYQNGASSSSARLQSLAHSPPSHS